MNIYINDFILCDNCGLDPDDCKCPPCSVCGETRNPECDNHMAGGGEIESLVNEAVGSGRFDLDLYNLSIEAAVEHAIQDLTPEHWNETDKMSFRYHLIEAFGKEYDRIISIKLSQF